MRTYLILFIFVSTLSTSARADFILSPGAGVVSAMSSEEKTNNKFLLKSNSGFGFTGNLDWILARPITFGIGLSYFASSGESQFQNEAATVQDLETQVTQFNAEAGLKIRLITTKHFKFFVGGGANLGSLILTFNENDYRAKTGTRDGYEMSETKGYQGYYLDAGIEYIFSNTNALRISGKQQNFKTKKFENLSNKGLTLNNVSFAVQYMHYVNWSFFWK